MGILVYPARCTSLGDQAYCHQQAENQLPTYQPESATWGEYTATVREYWEAHHQQWKGHWS